MSQPDPLSPRLLLHGTLSTSTFSLSQASPSSPPLTLHIRARLINASGPITVLFSNSVLSPSFQSFYDSYFSLTSTTDGSTPRQKRLHGMVAPRVTIRDPDAELVTFWPDHADSTTKPDTEDPGNGNSISNSKSDADQQSTITTTTTFSIPLGPHLASLYHERASESSSTAAVLPYLAIAGTPLSGLVVGETYELGLRDINGMYPAYVWWWEFGTKEEVMEKMGKGRKEGGAGGVTGSGNGGGALQVPVTDLVEGSGRGAMRVGVEMVEKPKLRILD